MAPAAGAALQLGRHTAGGRGAAACAAGNTLPGRGRRVGGPSSGRWRRQCSATQQATAAGHRGMIAAAASICTTCAAHRPCMAGYVGLLVRDVLKYGCRPFCGILVQVATERPSLRKDATECPQPVIQQDAVVLQLSTASICDHNPLPPFACRARLVVGAAVCLPWWRLFGTAVHTNLHPIDSAAAGAAAANFLPQMLRFADRTGRHHMLCLDRYADHSSRETWDYSAWIRVYSVYLTERLDAFRWVGVLRGGGGGATLGSEVA